MGDTENGCDAEQDIKNRAYAIWEDEGRPEGRHLEHWRQAAREIEQGKEAPKTPADAAPGGVVPAETSARKPKLPRV
jgi:Protein of unknown function (DUF2934)